jgi:hypothetical protein
MENYVVSRFSRSPGVDGGKLVIYESERLSHLKNEESLFDFHIASPKIVSLGGLEQEWSNPLVSGGKSMSSSFFIDQIFNSAWWDNLTNSPDPKLKGLKLEPQKRVPTWAEIRQLFINNEQAMRFFIPADYYANASNELKDLFSRVCRDEGLPGVVDDACLTRISRLALDRVVAGANSVTLLRTAPGGEMYLKTFEESGFRLEHGGTKNLETRPRPGQNGEHWFRLE